MPGAAVRFKASIQIQSRGEDAVLYADAGFTELSAIVVSR
jgi:hypothetical protein